MYEVVAHEIGHMWFPMMVGSDEKRFAWMDEGITQYDQSPRRWPISSRATTTRRENRRNYLDAVRYGGEVELMRHGDQYPNYNAYGMASYYKPATVLVALRGVHRRRDRSTGHSASTASAGTYKHPTPYDFFDTIEDVSGQDLVLVLADLVLRDLEAGPGHRRRGAGEQ